MPGDKQFERIDEPICKATQSPINIFGRTAHKHNGSVKGMTPTQTFCAEFQGVFDYFNQRLFNSELPECMLTIDMACRSAYGYYRPDCLINSDGEIIDQISMNPKHLTSRPMTEAVSTVAHEMAHLWMHRCSSKSVSGGYHCRTWGRKMEQIGLMPSHTGKPGGRKTGYQMTHYPIGGGPFLGAVAVLKRREFEFTWGRIVQQAKRQPPNRLGQNKGKVKFKCPQCGQSCWGAASLDLICGKDQHRMLSPL